MNIVESTPLAVESAGNELSDLAVRINQAHDKAVGSAQSAVDAAVQAGKLLGEAKAKVVHGQWLGWLEANFRGTVRNAQRYMRVAAKIATLTDTTRASHLSFRQLMELLAEREFGEPDDQVEALADPDDGTPADPLPEDGWPPKPDPNLIPQPGNRLTFVRVSRSANDILDISPSVHTGYFYVSVNRGCADGSGQSEGMRRPAMYWSIPIVVRCLGAENIVEQGQRTEYPAEGKNYNEWLYDSEEDYRESERQSWTKPAGVAHE